MNTPAKRRVQIIPVDRITVLNPRVRDQRKFRELVENISLVGLKRPVTVTPLPDKKSLPAYGLICGQGRLEACVELGQTTVAAIVIEADERDCLVMSIVENCARRHHRPADLLNDISALKQRGYTDAEIASKIGCTPQWVNMVVGLIERGEERLLAAVETGVLPVSVAMEISRTDDEGEQRLLAQAYAERKLSGGKLAKVRRLLEARRRGGRGMNKTSHGRKDGAKRPISTDALLRMLQQEADKQRLLVKKAEITQTRLLFTVEALRVLRSDENFVNLLRAEGLATMPLDLHNRMTARTS
ncbi:ParB N-terminal domain-containing protein [Methylobacterium sp. J-026]|uniref:plasmid partitioning protein RepB C-terminal domain-containing protein n=1 Tax=Methylobacterium sp. J-026 TaxID=2836624 RepID=UPI001FB950F8|nr:plasmid partitioning protein RepB C-terminal domain-containing protein [Methylobacterium sp. J-026]MCJ2132768.1 ParB N-terminal domain-containing protein [Methylobacterium sp. J-026]